jgi:GT2 family glycosyltransferase
LVEVLERIAVVIPAYGKHFLTRQVIEDLGRGATWDIFIIDNGGDFSYGSNIGAVSIMRPGRNLGWAGGCNFGIDAALSLGYDSFMLLNNDVRLSSAFVHSMADAYSAVGGAVLGPTYDHNWPHQRTEYLGPADQYMPRRVEREVPFIDGTCMMVSRGAISEVGLLDERTWPRHGWGCDKDYCLRVRSVGGLVWVTERAYLNHLGRQTAMEQAGYSEDDAERENNEGMTRKWGPEWRDKLYGGFPHISRLGTVQDRVSE